MPIYNRFAQHGRQFDRNLSKQKAKKQSNYYPSRKFVIERSRLIDSIPNNPLSGLRFDS